MIHAGDCLEVMPTLDARSVDSIVTDPPYGIGFMGKAWDHGVPGEPYWREAARVSKPGAYLAAFGGTRTFHRLACAIEDAGWELRDTLMWVYGSGFPKSHNGEWGGTALKPAWEPIVLARKPLIGTVEANWREHGTGALNIDGCRVDGAPPSVPQPDLKAARKAITGFDSAERNGEMSQATGRWPANVIHDGSEEVLAHFPHVTSGQPAGIKAGGQGNAFGQFAGGIPVTGFGDSGSAARFFYCAKASRADRDSGCEDIPAAMVHGPSGDGRCWDIPGSKSAPKSNNHPTVKPTDLMRWLCRLVTPPGGLVLDPFAGSGSTGRGAILEGFRFVGCELDPAYAAIAEARIAAATEQRRIDTRQPGLWGEAA